MVTFILIYFLKKPIQKTKKSRDMKQGTKFLQTIAINKNFS
jgi:hypothetical protein